MKIKVLDSSAIISNPFCFKIFGSATVCIPITVIEELDKIKSRTGEASVMARRFIKELDNLSLDGLLGFPGIEVGKGRLVISFSTSGNFETSTGGTLKLTENDNKILSTCLALQEGSPNSEVSLVTEDRNLRLKARFLGIASHGVPIIDCDILNDISYLDEVPDGIIRELFESSEGISSSILDIKPSPNKCFILRNGTSSALAKCKDENLIRVRKRDACNIVSKNVEQTFALDALLDPSVALVALTGKAGTGKTLLALAASLEQRSKYRQILLARPIAPLGNDIGYLPGDVNEKIKPYMQPLFDNLSVIKHGFKDNSEQQHLFSKLIEQEKLVIEPLTYIRGRSISKVFLIVDEAQNLTPSEIKAIVTRSGENTKVVFTGDTHQVDSCGLDRDSNGLSYLIRKFSGQPLFSHITLTRGERSELATLAAELL